MKTIKQMLVELDELFNSIDSIHLEPSTLENHETENQTERCVQFSQLQTFQEIA